MRDYAPRIETFIAVINGGGEILAHKTYFRDVDEVSLFGACRFMVFSH
jgi:hypothetical protein